MRQVISVPVTEQPFTGRHLIGRNGHSRDIRRETCRTSALTGYITPKLSLAYDNFRILYRPQYEHYCADLLRQAGWEANVTQGSGDQGVDILAEKAGHSLAIQCKKYGIAVGNKAVQEAHAGSEFVGADAAAIVTNSSFTPAAKALAGTLNVQLLHHEQLAKL